MSFSVSSAACNVVVTLQLPLRWLFMEEQFGG